MSYAIPERHVCWVGLSDIMAVPPPLPSVLSCMIWRVAPGRVGVWGVRQRPGRGRPGSLEPSNQR